ncbi:MAG: hypothetical protein E6845_07890 [Clostridium sp.]|nr:hypothetical protein [Clostridium sp.]
MHIYICSKIRIECPSISETTFMLTSFFINADANECLRLCTPRYGTLDNFAK